jgi:hypothetical protein
VRLSDSGVEKVPSIFISRLVNGGLAEMTGLLAVDDEVLEVNSIEVAGKSLDQVNFNSLLHKNLPVGNRHDGRELCESDNHGEASKSAGHDTKELQECKLSATSS